MSADTHDGEYHACEVTVRVSYKDGAGIPVMAEQGEGDAYEGEEHVEREEMGVDCWVEGWEGD